MIGEVATQPFDAFEVCRKAVLHDKVFAKTQNICGIEKRFFFCGDEEFLGGPFKAFRVADFFRQVIGVIIRIG